MVPKGRPNSLRISSVVAKLKLPKKTLRPRSRSTAGAAGAGAEADAGAGAEADALAGEGERALSWVMANAGDLRDDVLGGVSRGSLIGKSATCLLPFFALSPGALSSEGHHARPLTPNAFAMLTRRQQTVFQHPTAAALASPAAARSALTPDGREAL